MIVYHIIFLVRMEYIDLYQSIVFLSGMGSLDREHGACGVRKFSPQIHACHELR